MICEKNTFTYKWTGWRRAAKKLDSLWVQKNIAIEKKKKPFNGNYCTYMYLKDWATSQTDIL